MKFKYKMSAATDIGQMREINEDSVRVIPSINLAIVADGLSGSQNRGDRQPNGRYFAMRLF